MRSRASRPCASCSADQPRAARYCGVCGALLASPSATTPQHGHRPILRWAALGLAMVALGLATVGGANLAGRAPADMAGTSAPAAPGDPGVDLPPADLLAPRSQGGAGGQAPDAEPGIATCGGCERWRVDLEGSISSVLARDGQLIVGSTSGGVRLVDGETGVVRWQVPVGSDPTNAAPIGELVVVGTRAGRVIALGSADGTIRWEATVPTLSAGARPVAGDDDGVLVVAGAPPTRTAVALDAADGTVRWHRPLPGRWIGVGGQVVVEVDGTLRSWTPAELEATWHVDLADDEQLVARAGSLVVLRGPDGVRFLDADTGAEHAAAGPEITWWAAAPDGGLVLADTSAPGAIISLGPDGVERWRTPMADRGVTGCCVEVVPGPDGNVLVVDRRIDDRAAVLDLATGEVLADAGAAAGAVTGQLLIASIGDLGILQGDGQVTGVSIHTGRVRWRFHDASIVVSLDPLVVASRRTLAAPGPGWPDDPTGGPRLARPRGAVPGFDTVQ